MRKGMSRSVLTFVGVVALLVLLVIGVSVYLYTNSDYYIARYGKTVLVEGPLGGGKVTVKNVGMKLELPRKTQGTITHEADWSVYTSSEWEGLSFSFPSSWTLEESAFNNEGVVGELSTIRVEGDGYTASFTTVGKGLPTGPDTIATTETISGHSVNFYREHGYPGFMAVVSCSGRLGVLFTSKVDSLEVITRIIASLRCPTFEVVETVPYIRDGNQVTMIKSNITFALPDGWNTGYDSKPNESWEWDIVYLHDSTGKKFGSVSCPPLPTGGPYESAGTAPVLSREFSKNGIAFSASFSELGSNRYEEVQTEQGLETRYLGPPEKTNYVFSEVRTVKKDEDDEVSICLLRAGGEDLSLETISQLRSIYESWR